MRIKMTETQRGSVDGLTVMVYPSGETFDMGESEGARSLARTFIDAKWAVEVKNAGGAQENKAMSAPASTKVEASEDKEEKADPMGAKFTVEHDVGPWFRVVGPGFQSEKMKKRDAVTMASEKNEG